MNSYLSNKFRWLSVVATFAVVFCHSSTGRWVAGIAMAWVGYDFLSDCFGELYI